MKRLPFYIALCTIILSFIGCGAKRSQAYYNQPSVVLSAHMDGTYVIRVQVRAKDAVVAFSEAQRKVVKEIIFDGIRAGNAGVSDLKPLCFDKNAREKYEDYWNAFSVMKVHGNSLPAIRTDVLSPQNMSVTAAKWLRREP